MMVDLSVGQGKYFGHCARVRVCWNTGMRKRKEMGEETG